MGKYDREAVQRVLARPKMSKLVDGKQAFWSDLVESVKVSQVRANPETPKTLREHQVVAVGNVTAAYRSGATKCQLIKPTGTGKTLMISRIMLEMLAD